jgi:hypothetical protein
MTREGKHIRHCKCYIFRFISITFCFIPRTYKLFGDNLYMHKKIKLWNMTMYFLWLYWDETLFFNINVITSSLSWVNIQLPIITIYIPYSHMMVFNGSDLCKDHYHTDRKWQHLWSVTHSTKIKTASLWTYSGPQNVSIYINFLTNH